MGDGPRATRRSDGAAAFFSTLLPLQPVAGSRLCRQWLTISTITQRHRRRPRPSLRLCRHAQSTASSLKQENAYPSALCPSRATQRSLVPRYLRVIIDGTPLVRRQRVVYARGMDVKLSWVSSSSDATMTLPMPWGNSHLLHATRSSPTICRLLVSRALTHLFLLRQPSSPPRESKTTRSSTAAGRCATNWGPASHI